MPHPSTTLAPAFALPYTGPLQRAVLSTGESVLLRFAAADAPAARAALRNARSVLSALPTSAVLKPLPLPAVDDRPALALPDSGLTPLPLAPSVRGDLAAFLARAEALIAAVAAVHEGGVVHRSLTASAFWLASDGSARLTGFDEATRLSGLAVAPLIDPGALGPRLPYVAPEQTGRMNRAVDPRADLYTLGVVLFEQWTGAPPLSADDPAGWVHAHVARRPQRLAGPAALADLIDTLLAKAPEARYQTAAGLLADVRALAAAHGEGSLAGFVARGVRLSTTFRLPQQLFGRTKAVAALEGALESARTGAAEFIVVSGPAGIGKSRLIAELHPAVAAAGGFFATGKARRYERDRPYAVLAEALDGLLSQVLARANADVSRWAAALKEAVGPNGQVLSELVPAMAHLLGDTAPVPALAPDAARLRLAEALTAALAVLARPGHPVVLVLDDLQWADGATLALIERLLFDASVSALLLVGATRDAGLADGHPLAALLADLTKRRTPARRLALDPLGASAVHALVAAAVDLPRALTEPLAEVVRQKSGANPFFVRRFLQTLYEDGLLGYDPGQRRWVWDLEAIAAADITDNVVELLASRIRRLPDASRALLVQAATVGTEVAADTLAAVRHLPIDAVVRGLAPAIEQGLLRPVGEAALRPEAAGEGSRYRFVHDRVQEAARTLLPEREQVALHLAVARHTLTARTPGAPFTDDALFDLADHLTRGAAGLTGAPERAEAAEVLRRAAERARAAGAHELGRGHFETGLSLLPDDGWDTHYPLALALHQGLADAARLAGDSSQARALADVVDARARSALDRVGIHTLRTHLLINELQVSAAAQAVIATCGDLGHPVPVPTSLAALHASVGAVVQTIVGLGVEGVGRLPSATDPTLRATLEVLGGGLPSVAMGLQALHPAATVHGVELTLRHGVAPGSATAFSHLGILLCALGQYDAGWLVGQVSEGMRRRDLPDGAAEGLVEYLAFIHHWKAPFAQTAAGLAAGARRALELGDPNVYGYCVNTRYMVRLLSGTPLATLDADLPQVAATLTRHGQDLAALSVAIWGQAVATLRRGAADPAALCGDRFDAVQAAPGLSKAPPVISAYIACAQALLGLVFDAPDRALAAMRAHAPTLQDPAVAPAVAFPAAITYRAVATCALAQQAPPGEDRAALIAEAEADLARLHSFAATAPSNHAHRPVLVQAELHALQGRALEALDGFTEAARLAHQQGFVHDEGLAHHRAARCHLRSQRVMLARAHLREAERAYLAWGADAAAAQLHARHSDLLGSATDSRAVGPTLDVKAVLAASEALGAHAELSDLLETLMQIVVENAAAERGVLVLQRNDELVVAAEAKSDGVEVLQAVALDAFAALPDEIVQFVARTGEQLVLDDARESPYGAVPDVVARGVRAVLCVPLHHQGALLGVVYLENTLAPGVFTTGRARLVHAIASQGAIALQNAILLTEAREAASRLTQQNRRLTEVDRLRDDFLAKTSHELRTPLNGIIGLAGTLLAGGGGPLSATTEANLEMISLSGRRLASLINDILDFSALREDALSLHVEPTHTAEVVERAAGILGPLVAAKALTLRIDLPADLPRVMADPARLEQILLNLIGNAVKFTDAGTVTVAAAAEGDQVRVRVSDTGPGIAPAHQADVFNAFDQGEQHRDTGRGGTGLGLSIARQLIEAHGGRIGLLSALDEGSTFWFTLPVATGVEHLAHHALRRPSQAVRPLTMPLGPVEGQLPVGDGAHILVVDDEPINLQVILQCLRPHGFNVHTALGGRAALDRLADGLAPDAILLDVMMPDLDGLAVTEAIRQTQHGAALPILLVTAKNQPGDLVSGLAAGANDYVTKPIDGPELVARLRTHLTLSRFNRAVDRFVPHAFVDALGHGSLAELAPGDAKAQCMSVLFADMHGFGELTQGWAPDDSFRFVNEYLSVLEPVITAHGGFVDKYMGDTVMALFPGPLTDAVAAGVGLQHAITAFNAARRTRGAPPIRIGIGINQGDLVLGTVGNARRMDTTVISDAVNIAASLEGRTKRLRAGVLVGGDCRELLSQAGHRLRLADRLRADLDIYEVYDADPAGAVAAKDATRPTFERAVRAFHDKAFGEAERLFKVCRALDPADPAARDYAERCERVRRSIEGGAW